MNRSNATQRLVLMAVLSAVSFLLGFIEFPILPAAPFLKVDFGDVPVIIGMFSMGPSAGVTIAAIRWLVNYLVKMGTGGLPIGDIAGFIASLCMIFPLYYSVKRFGSGKKGKIIGTLSATLALTLVLSALNYVVIMPLYMKFLNFQVESLGVFIATTTIPFNFIKGLLVSTVFFLVYELLEPHLKKYLRSDGKLNQE